MKPAFFLSTTVVLGFVANLLAQPSQNTSPNDNSSGKGAHVQFSPDGKQLVTTSADNTVHIWDVSTGKQISGPPNNSGSEIVFKPVEYKQADTVLEGLSVYNDAIQGKRPAVLVVHQWKGLGDYEKKRAEMLARLGYNVFAVDIYGKGIRPQTPQAAGAEAGKYKNDRTLLRARIHAGLEVLMNHELTDPKRIAAIGYCFGGTTVLELARSGAEIVGVVSFHGGLSSPTPGDAKNIKARVLVLHGADDPNVPPKEVAAFEDEMRQGGVDWQLIAYGGAVHSFTDWNAGTDNSKGAAYNERADRRSWEAMKQFFAEVFK